MNRLNKIENQPIYLHLPPKRGNLLEIHFLSGYTCSNLRAYFLCRIRTYEATVLCDVRGDEKENETFTRITLAT